MRPRARACYARRMKARLYRPQQSLGPRELLWRFLIVIGLILTVSFIVYFEGGLRDNQTGKAPGYWDSLYFAIVTITTVGYGDIVPVNTFSRLVDAFLLTPIRFIVLFTILGAAYQLALRRLQEDYLMTRITRRLDGHILVCGFGNAGQAAVQELLLQGTKAEQIVVLAQEEEQLQSARDLGVIAASGDPTREQVLRDLQIERAAHVLVCPERDDTAVLVTLTVRDLNPETQIIAMCKEAENAKLLNRSGAHTIVHPDVAGGALMAAGTRRAHLVETLQDILSVGGRLKLDERPVRQEEIGRAPNALPGISVVRVYRDGRPLDLDACGSLQERDILVFVCRGSGAANTLPEQKFV